MNMQKGRTDAESHYNTDDLIWAEKNTNCKKMVKYVDGE